MPAKAVYLHQPSRLTHRHRRQASSLTYCATAQNSAPTSIQMWERACPRRRCISNNQAASPTAIAGKPAPPLMSDRAKFRTHRNPVVGAGLARDGNPPANHPPLDPPHSQAPARPHFSGFVSIYGMQIYILRYFKRWVYSRLHQHSLPKIKQVKRCSPNRCHYPPCRSPPTVSG